jgi:hypothetical protein
MAQRQVFTLHRRIPMMRPVAALRCAGLGLTLLAARLPAQDTIPLTPGSLAPDFSLGGGSREGVLPRPIRLSDLRDQTVVIAFFYQAKSKG